MRRRSFALVSALVLAAGAGGLFLGQHLERTRVKGIKIARCASGLLNVLGVLDLCTHGDDPQARVCIIPAFCLLDTTRPSPRPTPSPTPTRTTPSPTPTPTKTLTLSPSPTPSPTPPCIGDGRSGRRIHVFYAYSGTQDPDDIVFIRRSVTEADHYLATWSAPRTQTYRWLCENGQVVVTPIKVAGTSLGDFATAARNAGYNATDRIYTSMHPDGGGGTASIEGDDSPGQSNRNNTGPAYSITRGTSNWPVLVHELGHNLGAVQLSAPHSSGGWHCWDENDLLCYDDGGSYFQRGGQLQTICSGPQQFDCGRGDYYSPVPTDGWLATHWNVFNSGFLTQPP